MDAAEDEEEPVGVGVGESGAGAEVAAETRGSVTQSIQGRELDRAGGGERERSMRERPNGGEGRKRRRLT